MLAASLSINAAFLGLYAVRTARKGGIRYILEQLDLRDVPPPRLPFQRESVGQFRQLPDHQGEVDFVGDSLIRGGDGAEFFSDVKNRGIGGETTAGLLDRLDEITDAKPRQVWLLVGTNDLAAEVPLTQLVRNYRKILEKIRTDCPESKIMVVSILPVNQDVPHGRAPVHDNATIRAANRRIKESVAGFTGAKFVDVFDSMADERGRLREEWTSDGLHLNFNGYLALSKLFRPFVASPTPAAPHGGDERNDDRH
ncbi:MAG: GDSL-type esterase/lipase family protein [Isosphaeraceae bacterium]